MGCSTHSYGANFSPAGDPAWRRQRVCAEDSSRGPIGEEHPSQPSNENSELKRQLGNPDAPGHSGDLQNCDLADMEERLLQAVYS